MNIFIAIEFCTSHSDFTSTSTYIVPCRIAELYSKEIQQTSVGRWHIPCNNSDSWLCLSDTPTTDLHREEEEAVLAGHDKSWLFDETEQEESGSDKGNSNGDSGGSGSNNSSGSGVCTSSSSRSKNTVLISNYTQSDLEAIAAIAESTPKTSRKNSRRKKTQEKQQSSLSEEQATAAAISRVESFFINDRFEKKRINMDDSSSYREDVS